MANFAWFKEWLKRLNRGASQILVTSREKLRNASPLIQSARKFLVANRKVAFCLALIVIFTIGYARYGNWLWSHVPSMHMLTASISYFLAVFFCVVACSAILAIWLYAQERRQREAEAVGQRKQEETVEGTGNQQMDAPQAGQQGATKGDKPKEKESPKSVLILIFKGMLISLSIFFFALGAAVEVDLGNVILAAISCLIALGLLLPVFKRAEAGKQANKPAGKPVRKKKSVLVWMLKMVFFLWLILGICEWIAGGALHFAYMNGMLNHTVLVTKWGLPPYQPPIPVQRPPARDRKPGD